MSTIDRTPCRQCDHTDICKYKDDHNERIQRMEKLFDDHPESSIDTIYISCQKFKQQSALLKRSLEV